MQARDYRPEDYDMITEWFQSYGWPAMNRAFFPNDGVVIEHDGKAVCAAWVYLTNTPIAWIEHYICCKDFSKDVRDAALDLLVVETMAKAKELGYHVAMSSIKSPRLGKRLEAAGFAKSDIGMTNYVGVL